MINTFEFFQYYKNIYGGTKIPSEQSMTPLLTAAIKYLNRFFCLKLYPDLNDNNIKDCLCAICDLLFDRRDREALSSEHFDVLTKSYRAVDWDRLILKTAELYLPAELLYKGVC